MFRPSQVAFIDPAVRDAGFLAKHLQLGIEPVLLDPTRPALAQMAEFLAARPKVDVIHIVAHGQSGQIDFTAGSLTRERLTAHWSELSSLARGL